MCDLSWTPNRRYNDPAPFTANYVAGVADLMFADRRSNKMRIVTGGCASAYSDAKTSDFAETRHLLGTNIAIKHGRYLVSY